MGSSIEHSTGTKRDQTLKVADFMYCSGIWTATTKDVHEIHSPEMKLLRVVKKGQEPTELETKTCETWYYEYYSISDKVKDDRQKWKEHMERTNIERLPENALKYKATRRKI